jgi:hypothetical protein
MPEIPFVRPCLKISVCGAYYADVDRHNFRAAYADDFLLLQYTQKAGLDRLRQLADFIKEQRAFMSQFKKTSFPLTSHAGERAFLVSEKLAFQKAFGDGRTVYGYKRLLAALARPVNALSEQFFAGAGFALQNNGGIRCDIRGRKAFEAAHFRFRAGNIRKLVSGCKPFGLKASA